MLSVGGGQLYKQKNGDRDGGVCRAAAVSERHFGNAPSAASGRAAFGVGIGRSATKNPPCGGSITMPPPRSSAVGVISLAAGRGDSMPNAKLANCWPPSRWQTMRKRIGGTRCAAATPPRQNSGNCPLRRCVVETRRRWSSPFNCPSGR